MKHWQSRILGRIMILLINSHLQHIAWRLFRFAIWYFSISPPRSVSNQQANSDKCKLRSDCSGAARCPVLPYCLSGRQDRTSTMRIAASRTSRILTLIIRIPPHTSQLAPLSCEVHRTRCRPSSLSYVQLRCAESGWSVPHCNAHIAGSRTVKFMME